MLEQNDQIMGQLAKAGGMTDKAAFAVGKSLVVFYVSKGLYQIPGVGPLLRFFWRLAVTETTLRSDTPQEKK
jgi:hypothetical protein